MCIRDRYGRTSAAAHSLSKKVRGYRTPAAEGFAVKRPHLPCDRAAFQLLNSAGPMMMNNSTHEFERLLGKAALALWSDFPRDVQETLFETAVARDVIIRNHLASYLHDHHPKTAHPAKPAQSA